MEEYKFLLVTGGGGNVGCFIYCPENNLVLILLVTAWGFFDCTLRLYKEVAVMYGVLANGKFAW